VPRKDPHPKCHTKVMHESTNNAMGTLNLDTNKIINSKRHEEKTFRNFVYIQLCIATMLHIIFSHELASKDVA